MNCNTVSGLYVRLVLGSRDFSHEVDARRDLDGIASVARRGLEKRSNASRADTLVRLRLEAMLSTGTLGRLAAQLVGTQPKSQKDVTLRRRDRPKRFVRGRMRMDCLLRRAREPTFPSFPGPLIRKRLPSRIRRFPFPSLTVAIVEHFLRWREAQKLKREYRLRMS